MNDQSKTKHTSVEVLNDLDAGVFAEKIGAAISAVALNTCVHGQKGRVQITLDMTRIGESSQIELKHTLLYSQPTGKGVLTEKNITVTPMHVGPGGVMSLFPLQQRSLFPSEAAEGRAAANRE